MRHSMLLIHPAIKKSSIQKNDNIFHHARLSQSLPSIRKPILQSRQNKLYDFVGSTQFKRKSFFQQSLKSTDGISHRTKEKNQNNDKKESKQLDETMRNFSKIANSTINRETIMSKLTKHQQIEATRQRRNIDRYKSYQQYWQDQGNKMKRLLNKKRPSLVELSKQIVIQQNQNKQDIINNYIVHYWEMSLRNHNPILKGHIKGNNFGETELQEMLQRDLGVKQVESSIPKLPLQALKRTHARELSLSGRSKSGLQSKSLSQRNSQRYSNRDIMNQQQVYKISYDGDKKYLGVQGF